LRVHNVQVHSQIHGSIVHPRDYHAQTALPNSALISRKSILPKRISGEQIKGDKLRTFPGTDISVHELFLSPKPATRGAIFASVVIIPPVIIGIGIVFLGPSRARTIAFNRHASQRRAPAINHNKSAYETEENAGTRTMGRDQ
jgi:hypothetical protein